MRIQRVITKQGHPVPKSGGYAKGPFPQELYQRPEVISDYVPADETTPPGGTAQNNYREPRAFRCSFCDEVMYEHQTIDHKCEGMINGTNS
jgi:hypothetical protein